MLRVQKLAALASLLLAVWIALLQAVEKQPQRTLLLLAPVLAVAGLGAYLLLALLLGVLTFRTVPEEADLLKQDIKQAREALAAKGIKA